jgi:hypothetical protein
MSRENPIKIFKDFVTNYINHINNGKSYYSEEQKTFVPSGHRSKFYDQMLKQVNFKFQIKTRDYTLTKTNNKSIIENPTTFKDKLRQLVKVEESYKILKDFNDFKIDGCVIRVNHSKLFTFDLDDRYKILNTICQYTKSNLLTKLFFHNGYKTVEDMTIFKDKLHISAVKFNYECLLGDWVSFKQNLNYMINLPRRDRDKILKMTYPKMIYHY